MRKLSKKRQAAIDEMLKPAPPIADTIAKLNELSAKKYETKARTKNAIRDSHLALVEVLQTLEAYSKHSELVARSTVESIHKTILRKLKLPTSAPMAGPVAPDIQPCVRDDSTECDCSTCRATEDRFWDEQGAQP